MKAVIHNYNNDFSYLLNYFEDFIIYEASDQIRRNGKIQHDLVSENQVIYTENIGHSLTN